MQAFKRPAVWLATVAVVLGMGGSAVAASTEAQVQDGTLSAAIACKKATIGGATKCIARGQFCAVRHQKDYKRNGFSCQKDRGGRYRLS